jgi:hypothetical protein
MSFTGKILVPALLLLSCTALSGESFAHTGADFSNNGGRWSGTTAGLSLSGSILTVVTGLNGGIVAADLDSLTFTTRALTSGTLNGVGRLAGGGTFMVVGSGMNGIPNGMLFSGTFSGPRTWVTTNLTAGRYNYTLTGVVSGTAGGRTTDGVTCQLTIDTEKGYFNGSSTIAGGDTVVSLSVPEPSTVALFGTGTFVLAGALRRKAPAGR